MIGALAVAGYRSLRDVCVPLGRLTVIRGGNGVGKSSLYQAFRLLADTAGGRLIGSLARAGGLESVLWAGPEVVSGAMRRGEVPVQGQAHRHRPVSLMLGFSGDDVSYLIDIGLPLPDTLTKFGKDPQIKREAVWVGPVLRPAATLVQRANGAVQVRVDAGWTRLPPIGHRESIVADLADPVTRPELALLRGMVASWRFYDDFRTDVGSPARAPQVGTWSPSSTTTAPTSRLRCRQCWSRPGPTTSQPSSTSHCPAQRCRCATPTAGSASNYVSPGCCVPCQVPN